MPLSERQLAQRRAASLSAAAKRRERGLTERETAQRRVNAWKSGAAHRARVNKRRKEVDEGIRQRAIAQGAYYKLTPKQEDANITRLNKVWGIPIITIINNRLQEVAFSNPALQSWLTKWSNLRAKGLSPDQAIDILEHRYTNVMRRDRMDSTSMLDLVRENYPISRRDVRRHRRPLTDRQHEMKQRRDAKYRESKRRRRAA